MATVNSNQPVPNTATPKRPKVLIVGAGIAGLTLAMLLTKAGIPYDIYERAEKVKNLG